MVLLRNQEIGRGSDELSECEVQLLLPSSRREGIKILRDGLGGEEKSQLVNAHRLLTTRGCDLEPQACMTVPAPLYPLQS